MPVTPAHFGIGLPLKAVLGRRFSLMAFSATQAALDIPVVAAWALTGDPSHESHAPLIAAGIALACACGPARRAYEAALRLWNRREPRLAVESSVAPAAAWLGSVAGVASHLGLDAMMHGDVLGGRLVGLVDPGVLTCWLLVAGAAGLGWLLVESTVRRAKSTVRRSESTVRRLEHENPAEFADIKD